MKKKIVGVLVCMLLVVTMFSVMGAKDNEIKAINNTANGKCDTSFFEIEEDTLNIKPDNPKDINTVMLDQLDQQQETNTGSERIQLLSGGLAQSFKPSLPTLTRVAVLWEKSSGDPEFVNYYIEIRTDVHSSAYLRRIQIDKTMLLTGTVWYIWDFSDIAVTIGSDYWIVVYADSPAIYTTQVKWCYGSPGDPYPNGYSMINTFIGWQAYDLWGDFCFRTYGEGSANNPPNTPSTPTGPSTGTVGVSYSYTTSTTDPDGDDVSYGWDWNGDSIVDEYSGLLSTGTPCTMSHSWSYAGTFQVKVTAKDENNALSAFSPALTVTISAGNSPPNKPDTPSGPTSGKVLTSYTYTSSVIDPEGDKIYLMFDWGDGTNSGWLGLYNSGDTVTASHVWSIQGSYAIKAKAKDEHDVESVWSDPLPISMPKPLRFSVWDALERINDWLLQVAGREILPEIFNP